MGEVLMCYYNNGRKKGRKEYCKQTVRELKTYFNSHFEGKIKEIRKLNYF